MIKNPNWQEATIWLFTSVAEDLNSGRSRTNPANGQSRARIRDRRMARPTRPPLGHAASLNGLGGVFPGGGIPYITYTGMCRPTGS